jgi:gluconokinase
VLSVAGAQLRTNVITLNLYDANPEAHMTRTEEQHQPVLVIMGVSGSGKSTVAAILAGQLGWDLEEGDDLHPARNVAKMAAGQPLTDEDRWPWLDKVSAWITDHTTAGIPGIITCSALKRSYRDRMRGSNVVFVHLAGSKDRIGQRLAARTDHFMPTTLLDSQLTTLEPPGPDENTLAVDVGRKPAEVAAEIIRRLGLVQQEGSSTLGSTHPGTSSAPALSDLWDRDQGATAGGNAPHPG